MELKALLVEQQEMFVFDVFFYFILLSNCKDFYLVCKYVKFHVLVSSHGSLENLLVAEGSPCLKS